MKTIIVYYSFEGNTRFIAETLAKTLRADLLELMPKEDVSSKGFMKYVWGGRQAMQKVEPELKPLDKNPDGYERIIIGSPVWAWTFAPALRTFFRHSNFKGKKVAIFLCHGGGPGKAMEKTKNELEGNKIVGEILFEEPLQDKKANKQKAIAWTKSLKA